MRNRVKNLLLIVFTLIAFAANSVLCRIALKGNHIDPLTLSDLRLLSGAVVLFLFLGVKREWQHIRWDIPGALLLIAYAMTFSLAYVRLEAATGALMLFGSVQVCMVAWGVVRGEKPGWLKSAGILLAVVGICALLLPGAKAPPVMPALVMVISGLAWGAYSIRGKNVTHAAGATAGNFILSLPVVVLIAFFTHQHATADMAGILLALASGGIASGIAYVLWYDIVPRLSSSTASTLQLSVPCIATAGGMFFLGEVPDMQMVMSTLAVLAGIAMVITADRVATR